MVSSDETLALNLLDEHDSILKKHIKNKNGHIIKHIGDAVFAEFKEINDSIKAAIEIQKELKSRNEISRGKNKINIRIGLHYGTVIEKDNDLFGHDVNICARIEGHAFVEGIAISQHALDKINNTDYFTRSYGYVKLKNIANAVELFKVYIDKNEFLEETKDVFINYIKNKGFNIVDIDSYVSKHIISIAMLYPQNLGNSSDDFFCYAFLDQIIKDLQKSHELRVPNIFDIQKFKDSDSSISEISRKLNVEHAIQTSIIKNNNNIKINIQILSTVSGEIIIQETWDGKVNDLTKISGKICLLILDHFSLDIPDILKDVLEVDNNINEEAYKFFLEGHYIFNHIKDPKDFNKSRELFEKAIGIDNNFVAAHYMLGMTFNSIGRLEDAEEELDIAEEIAEDTDNIKALANVYNYKGVFYRFKGQYKKSIRFFEKGLKFQKEVHDEITEANILNNMSACLANAVIKEHDKALQLLKRSKEIYNQYEMYLPLANSYAETGGIYKNLNQFTSALENYEKAKQYYYNENMHFSILMISVIMGDIYNSLGMVVVSRKQLNEAKEYAHSFNNQNLLGRFYSGIATSYEIESNLEIAIENMEKAKSYFDNLNKNNLLVPCLIDLSLFHYRNNNLKKANEYIMQADAILKSGYTNEIFSIQTKVYINLYKDKNSIDRNAVEVAFNTVESKKYDEILNGLVDVYKKIGDEKKYKKCTNLWNSYVQGIASNILNKEQKSSYLEYNLIS